MSLIVTALLNGIECRFADIFDDSDAIAASILHPRFRNTWTNNQSLIDIGMRHNRLLLQTTMTMTQEAGAAADAQSTESSTSTYTRS